MKIGKYRVIDLLNPRKWVMFLKYKAYEWGNPLPDTIKAVSGKQGEASDDLKAMSKEDLVAYSQMVVYRMSLCNSCVKGGECHHCGCPSPGLFLDQYNSCFAGNWGSIDSMDKWRQYVEKNGITFEVKYNV